MFYLGAEKYFSASIDIISKNKFITDIDLLNIIGEKIDKNR